ncbi:hypothetical protein MKEN_00270800 [Mycena kentingensis (nom. inval.)]|nr:hypothetical protein MKEN_00270800 [Mycena kentingensis (nom. inval.)]
MAATPGIPCLPDYLTALATLNLHGLALAPDIERVLFDIVPMETRKEGGRLLHDAIRRVWVSGMMFADYRRESQGAAPEPSPPAPPVDLSVSEAAVEAARAAYTSALEAERVWGFDVGYRVAVGTLSTHSPPSAPSPSPSTPTLPVADNVPADVAVAVAPVDESPSPPLFPPRDLSALRPDTGSNIFGSLQRRRRRSKSTIGAAKNARSVHPFYPDSFFPCTMLPFSYQRFPSYAGIFLVVFGLGPRSTFARSWSSVDCVGLVASGMTIFGDEDVAIVFVGICSSGPWFPANVKLPDNTLIPFWAGTDPTTWPNGRFDSVKASQIAAEAHPEYSQSARGQTSASKSKTPIGPIVGGVVGGVAILAIGGLVAWFYLRRSNGSRSDSEKDAHSLPRRGHAHSDGGTSVFSLSRPPIHGRSLSDLSGKSILSAPQSHSQSHTHAHLRPGTIYTTATGQTHDSGSISYLSGYGSPVTSPGPGPSALFANREEIIEPYTIANAGPAAPGPGRKASGSTLRSAYQSHEGGMSLSSGSPSGSANVSVAPTPGTPSAQMTSYMDAVPEGVAVSVHSPQAQAGFGFGFVSASTPATSPFHSPAHSVDCDYARARDAQEEEYERLRETNTSPPAYTPYPSPSTSPEPLPDPALIAGRHGHRKQGPSMDSFATSSEGTVRSGHGSGSGHGHGEGSIGAIDEVIEQMGLAMPTSPTGTAPTTVATGQSGDLQAQARGMHKPSVSNP